MSRFSQIKRPADPELATAYERALAMGFTGAEDGVPSNWVTSQSARPDLLQANLDYAARVFGQGQLPLTVKQLLLMTVAMQSDCKYCLVAHSSATDTDWFVIFADEAPDGGATILTRGWLRASHREVDAARSTPYRPWRPHTRQLPLAPKQPETFPIEIIPTCNVFRPGHRIRLEIASCDNMVDNPFWYHLALPIKATNTVLEGKAGSRLVLPVIPR